MNSPAAARPAESKPRVRPGAGILIVSPDDRLLIVRQEHEGVVDWGPLGGGMEAGEGIRECAVREAYEEPGRRVKLVRLLSVDEFWHAGQLQRVGFVFVAEPDPWPQRVRLPDFDGDTRFLDHRWVSGDEVQRFAVTGSWEFWACYWPLDVHETLLGKSTSNGGGTSCCGLAESTVW